MHATRSTQVGQGGTEDISQDTCSLPLRRPQRLWQVPTLVGLGGVRHIFSPVQTRCPWISPVGTSSQARSSTRSTNWDGRDASILAASPAAQEEPVGVQYNANGRSGDCARRPGRHVRDLPTLGVERGGCGGRGPFTRRGTDGVVTWSIIVTTNGPPPPCEGALPLFASQGCQGPVAAACALMEGFPQA